MLKMAEQNNRVQVLPVFTEQLVHPTTTTSTLPGSIWKWASGRHQCQQLRGARLTPSGHKRKCRMALSGLGFFFAAKAKLQPGKPVVPEG